MGPVKLLLCGALIFVVCIESSAAAGSCPPPEKITDYTKKESCRGDGECKNGKICCPNPARVRSCTYPAPYSSGGGGKGQQAEVWCDGVKCQPYQVCKADPNNKYRKTCQRA